jgi:hypothetical protein
MVDQGMKLGSNDTLSPNSSKYNVFMSSEPVSLDIEKQASIILKYTYIISEVKKIKKQVLPSLLWNSSPTMPKYSWHPYLIKRNSKIVLLAGFINRHFLALLL